MLMWTMQAIGVVLLLVVIGIFVAPYLNSGKIKERGGKES